MHKLSYTDEVSKQTFEILQCGDCGLMMTQHAPLASEMERFYPDKEAACYKQPQGWMEKIQQFLNNQWYQKQVDVVCEECDRVSGVLLEIGCKQGHFANTIRQSGWIAHAIEGDNTAREYANNRFLLQAESTDVLFNIKPRSYNVVVAWDSLGESVDLHRTLDHMSKLIVSDGTLIIAFHDAASGNEKGNTWLGWNAPRKRWHLTHKAMEQLAAQHNLTIVNRRGSALRSFLTSWKSEMANMPHKNAFILLCKCLTRHINKHNNTYYIYTLKHQ